MKTHFSCRLRFLLPAATLLLAFAAAGEARAQGTSFMYQGRLQDGGANANGNYDFQFTLWDSLSGGTQQPQPSPATVNVSSVPVANGVFTVQLDFGASAFPGADRFLETSVRAAGSGSFTLLAPRQPITSTPYAIRSASAASADSVPIGAIPAGSGNYVQNSTSLQANANFNVSGNGTAGGTLSGNIVNAGTQFNLGGNRVLIAGPSNLFAGFNAGANNAGANNTFLGASAGKSNTTGGSNTFVGSFAGVNSLTGSGNSFFGFNTGNSTSGTSNSFFGTFAGMANTTGAQNNFFGEGAGGNTSTGGNNSFFGNTTGLSNTTEFANSLLGSFADTAFGISNSTAIGFRAKVTQSNSLVLGSISGVNGAGFSTNVGIGTTAPTSRLHVVGDTNLVGNLTVSGTLNATLAVPYQLIGNLGSQGIFSALNQGKGPGVYGASNSDSDSFGGVTGDAPTGDGVIGNGGRSGVLGRSPTGNGVWGISQSATFSGVSGFNTNGGNGVAGTSPGGIGVSGNSTTGPGVEGVSDSGNGGVFQSTSGIGVSGRTNTASFPAVIGVNDSSGDGVRGSSISGIGVHGVTTSGFAGYFEGKSYFSGNVGIGTSGPSAKLDVLATGGQNVFLGGGNLTGSELKLTNSGTAHFSIYNTGNSTLTFANTSTDILTNTLGSPLMQLSSAANLQVFGRVRANTVFIDNYVSGQNLSLCTASTGGNVNLIGLCTSSLRYKKNVQRFRNGLDVIKRLNPISFDWTENGQHDLGLAAEEVNRVEPLLTFRNNQGQIEGVKYNQLSAVFINAFKEQQAQIEKQQEQLKQQQDLLKQEREHAGEQRALFAEQQRQLEALKKLVCRSHPRAAACR